MILVINGPNLNLLGERDPGTYGTVTLPELEAMCREWGAALGFEVSTYQSNHEGELIDRLHEVRHDHSGAVLNPGALTHTSYALHDAIAAVPYPVVEVHISNIKAREAWRRNSVVAPAVVRSIYGRGIDGYLWALRHLRWRREVDAIETAYGASPDQVGDLRIPDGPGPHAVVVLYHGGFWRDPWQRDLMDAAAVDLTRRGFATWNVEYRRVGTGGGWPATLADAGAALDHVDRLAAEHPLDTGRLVVLGHSAGGHLALWVASRAGPVLRPTGVVAVAPVTDLAASHRLGLGGGAVEDFLRRRPDQDSSRYRAADPGLRGPPGMPQIVVHGDADQEVPLDTSRAYAAAAGADLEILPGVDHYAPILAGTAAWDTVAAAVARLL